MNRREFTGLSLGSFALASMSVTGESQEPAGAKKDLHAKHAMQRDGFMKCAQACSSCQHECDSCATHCANILSEGKKEHMATLMSCRDCADFCTAAAQIVARGGPFSALICESCAEACARCGQECEKFPDDEHMKRCAQECRKCEKECREMAKHPGHK